MDASLFEVDPATLAEARLLCHDACQWPSRAARANLSAREDDSHSNLGWNSSLAALVSRGLDIEQQICIGFSFDRQSLLWLVEGEVADALQLSDETTQTTQTWVDGHLTNARLSPSAVAEMPYVLDQEVDYSGFAACARHARNLGAWYQCGDETLRVLASEIQHLAAAPIAPLEVRCWPHHFDIATLAVFDDGDPETARSIGIGMSPGDTSYAEPYFYCSPWPAPDANTLPSVAAPLSWHTHGFVSLVAPARSLTAATEIADTLALAVTTAYSLIRAASPR